MPENATVEEVEEVYFEGWKMGLKALAIYRDNCKVGQPLNNAKSDKTEESAPAAVAVGQPTRRRLSKSRSGKTISFTVAGAEGYLTTGAYDDGALGEIFLKMSKQGSTLAGVMDAFSIAISIGLQYGVPLETFVQKFVNMRFEPTGMTDDKDIRMAQSITDFVFRRLALDYLPYEKRAALGIFTADERAAEVANGYEIAPVAANPVIAAAIEAEVATKPVAAAAPTVEAHSSTEVLEALLGTKADAPLCMTCGIKMRAAGSCYVCEGCGNTSGCS
jgi:ribonucleoside-diphosphate reductase alpha chain